MKNSEILRHVIERFVSDICNGSAGVARKEDFESLRFLFERLNFENCLEALATKEGEEK